jgi:formylglycine-generating enzyme
VTVAERPLDPVLFRDLPPEDREPGALVFTRTPGPVDLSDWRQWWRWSVGADRRHPFGPPSNIAEKADHPVVRVSYYDAEGVRDLGGREALG